MLALGAAGCGESANPGPGSAGPVASSGTARPAELAVRPASPERTSASPATPRHAKPEHKKPATGRQERSGSHRSNMSEQTSASRGSRRTKQSTPRHRIPRPHLTVPQRKNIALQVAKSYITLYGLDGTTAMIVDAGRTMSLNVPASKACGLPSGAEGRLSVAVRHRAPWIHTVSMTVGGSSLSTYTRANCRTEHPPHVTGAKLLEQRGTGYTETKTFHVTAKHWTVAWANEAKFLSGNVEKNGQTIKDFFYTMESGTGRKTFNNGPGTFRLFINGPAWEITVYDGG